jgi:hypothetical protein
MTQGLLASPSNHEYPTIALSAVSTRGIPFQCGRGGGPTSRCGCAVATGRKVLESFHEEFEIGSCMIAFKTGKIAHFTNGEVPDPHICQLGVTSFPISSGCCRYSLAYQRIIITSPFSASAGLCTSKILYPPPVILSNGNGEAAARRGGHRCRHGRGGGIFSWGCGRR